MSSSDSGEAQRSNIDDDGSRVTFEEAANKIDLGLRVSAKKMETHETQINNECVHNSHAVLADRVFAILFLFHSIYPVPKSCPKPAQKPCKCRYDPNKTID